MAESDKTSNSTARSKTSRAAKTAVTGGAKAPARTAKDSAQSGKETLAGIGGTAAEKGRTAARTVQRTVGSAAEQTVGKVGTAVALVKTRKVIVAGASAGAAVVVASSYSLGRRVGLRQRGPLSRLTGGRV